ncbi:MAG TPA: hypothetical protein VFQ54_07650, partial [Thermomicrobiales bacterium]|nr:hypothetical protein [Thermomicrobiales bacterium]
MNSPFDVASARPDRTASWRRILSGSTPILIVASLVGLIGFLSPLVLPLAQRADADTSAHAGDAPILFALVTA